MDGRRPDMNTKGKEGPRPFPASRCLEDGAQMEISEVLQHGPSWRKAPHLFKKLEHIAALHARMRVWPQEGASGSDTT